MKERRIQPTEKHRAFRDDLVGVLRKYGDQIDAMEMLALSAHLVGQILALQDQRTMSREVALEIVIKNIEAGNAEVITGLDHPAGTT